MDTLNYILKNRKIELPTNCRCCMFSRDNLDNTNSLDYMIYCRLIDYHLRADYSPVCTKEMWVKEIEDELETEMVNIE